MKYILLLLIVVILSPIKNLQSQNLFPEKFSGCNTDAFSLESDSTTAKISKEECIRIITNGFDEKTKVKVRGILSLQIIVNFDGTSCLISVKNDTNIKTSKLKLKETVDSNLTWSKIDKKVSAVVVLKFAENGVWMKRVGTNANTGVHELRE